MKHKILFVMRCFPALGGVEKLSWQLAKAFRREGHETIFVSWLPAQPAWTEAETFPIIYLPDTQSIDAKHNLAFLKNYIEENQIDIILNQVPESRIQTCFANSREHQVVTMLHAHPDWLFQRRRQMDFPRAAWKPTQWKALLRYFYVKLFPALSDKKVCQILREDIHASAAYVLLHPSYKDLICRRLGASLSARDADKIFAIPNPVAPSALQTTGEKIILYAGRFSCKDKGLDILLRVWSKLAPLLPDWQLQLRGDGPDKAKLQDMIQREHVQRVALLPPVWDDSLYAQASVFALPSRTEAQGLAQMEAQQAGMVVVAFRLNAMIEELVQDQQSGLLLPCFDEAAYADALLRICRDQDLRRSMSQAARRNMQAYQIDKILPLWLRLFDDLFAR